jgi:hypothetical protein
MESAGIALIIAGSSLLLTLLFQVWGGSWKLSGKLAEIDRGLNDKIREVELFVRDKYIEKNDFIIQMQHHNEMISMNFSNITARLDRMEKKLDQKT